MAKGEEEARSDEAAEWFFRRDGGSLSADDERRFAHWLSHPANRAAYAEIEATWSDLAAIARPANRNGLKRAGWAAAALAIAASFAAWLFDAPMRLRADGYTSIGETRTLTLPDGSRATLNTNSALVVAYAPDARRVRLLRGEAVFAVAKDASRPFLVDAAGGEARAVGTEFDVRYEGDGATVTGIENRVSVSFPAGAASGATVAPNLAVDYSPFGLGPVHAVDATRETAWLRGKIIFVDRPLGAVVAELNRYHRGRIEIMDGSLRDLRVSGVFETAKPLRAVEMLERSVNVRATRLTDYLVLLHR